MLFPSPKLLMSANSSRLCHAALKHVALLSRWMSCERPLRFHVLARGRAARTLSTGYHACRAPVLYGSTEGQLFRDAARTCSCRAYMPGAFSCRLHPEVRYYSSGQGEQSSKFQGTVMLLPNPFLHLKNKFREYQVCKFVDASFSLSAFAIGAGQAIAYVSQLLASRNYDGMKGLLTDEAIATLRDITASWTDEKQTSIEIRIGDIVANTPVISGIEHINNRYLVDVDSCIITLKTFTDQFWLITFKSRFQRSYGHETVSDWTVVKVDELSVRTFQQK